MAEMVQVELVVPADVIVSTQAEMVVLPGSEGQFGVLPHHAPIRAGLQRGVVEFYQDGQVATRVMIDGGLADVSPEKLVILAERAEPLDKAQASLLDQRAAHAEGDEADFLKAVRAAL